MQIKKDSHRDLRAHRGKILGALGVLGGKKYTLSTIKNRKKITVEKSTKIGRNIDDVGLVD
jgi:hypothetical protein